MQKTAIVTGGSKGIGQAIAVALAQEGFSVAVLYRSSKSGAQETVRRITAHGGTAQMFSCDVADSAAVKDAVRQITDAFGAASVLVNNAGIAQQKLFTDISDDDWDSMLATNLSGAFYMTRAVLPEMIRQKSGRVINIASMWGETGGSCEVHYSAAKAGLIGLTKALAKELAPSGITVNAVSPGAVMTDMMSALGEETCRMVEEEVPLGRLGTPQDIADAVCFLASEKAAYITGQVLSVNGGLVT